MRPDQESSKDQDFNNLSPPRSEALPAGRLCIKLKLPQNNMTMIRKEGEGAERAVIPKEGEWSKRPVDKGSERPVNKGAERAVIRKEGGTKRPEEGVSKTHIDNSRNGYRVCEICGKEFSSGKAWGGHKRHHLKTMRLSSKDEILKIKAPAQSMKKKVGATGRCNTIKAGDVKIKEGKPLCCLCGKSFSSMNALFGHMKFHPDRDWKGTQPPLMSNNNNNTSNLSNSIGELESELHTVIYVDLSSSLVGGWGNTDKRGKESIYDYDPDVYQAAMGLMKLSRDTRVLTQPLQLRPASKSKNSKITKSDDDDRGFLRHELAKKMKRKASTAVKKKYLAMLSADDNDDELIRPGGFNCNVCGSSFSTFQALGGHKSSCNGKKSEESSEGRDDNQEENIIVVQSGGCGNTNLFQCDICNKSFSSGQALGGHKRIHWKPSPLKTQLVPIEREYGYHDYDDNEGHNTKLGFDLNEPYVLQDDEY